MHALSAVQGRAARSGVTGSGWALPHGQNAKSLKNLNAPAFFLIASVMLYSSHAYCLAWYLPHSLKPWPGEQGSHQAFESSQKKKKKKSPLCHDILTVTISTP